jgi:3-oxoacyl-[acyl-carrier protein] reductase
MDLELAGRTIVISGASRGIGRAIADRLAAEGAHVVIAARDAGRVEAAVRELESAGTRAAGIAVDVTTADGCARLIGAARERFGRVDGVVANAGGAVGEPRFDDTTADDWLASYRWNVVHAVELLHAARADLRASQGAAVLIGSISAALPSPWPQYAAAKAALESVSRSVAAEYAVDGIRVNCVRPGSVMFEGGAWANYAAAEPDAFGAFVSSDLPFGRLARPEEIANVVTFLLSPASGWVTGAVIPVDGGQRRSSPFPARDPHLGTGS